MSNNALLCTQCKIEIKPSDSRYSVFFAHTDENGRGWVIDEMVHKECARPMMNSIKEFASREKVGNGN